MVNNEFLRKITFASNDMFEIFLSFFFNVIIALFVYKYTLEIIRCEFRSICKPFYLKCAFVQNILMKLVIPK